MEITNQKLMQFHQELQNLNTNSVLGYLLIGKVNDFYKHNGIRVQTCIEAIQKIQFDHLEMDEKDHPKLTDPNDPNSVILLEGKTMEQLNSATLFLMNKIVNIK